MEGSENFLGTYTDLYELTMAQGYYLAGKKDDPAIFDYFFRDVPFDGGYVIFAGLEEFLSDLERFRFGDDDIRYLTEQGFRNDFLDWLRDFRFQGTIHAMREGEVVFPLEPIVRVEGNLIETQLIETLLLNHLNFCSLIATKAARVRESAGDAMVADFGLRRAQGWGGVEAAKGAYIGGVDATSNTYAGKVYGIPITGTQAHSWIQSFSDELTAFREFVKWYPGNSILLVDTYDTLKSGVPNAITVAHEMAEEGKELAGIRLDSGDLAYLSKKARKLLDDAGLQDVKIIASNQLDEYVIDSLRGQGAPLDGYGVGTNLVVGRDSAALDGVYKMSACNEEPRIKQSENVTKVNFPGRKTVLRFYNADGTFHGDGVFLEEEVERDTIVHPFFPEKRTDLSGMSHETLMSLVMKDGNLHMTSESLTDKAHYVRERLTHLPAEHKRFISPHIYKVGIGQGLMEMRDREMAEH